MKKENFGYVVFLSVVAAIGGILFGYDTAVFRVLRRLSLRSSDLIPFSLDGMLAVLLSGL